MIEKVGEKKFMIEKVGGKKLMIEKGADREEKMWEAPPTFSLPYQRLFL